MRKAVSREGRDHATLLPRAGAVAVAAFALLAVELPAQQPVAQSAACTTIADDAQRLACYDRALRAASPDPAAPAAAAQTPAAAAEATPAQTPARDTTASREPQRDADKAPIAIVVVGVRTVQARPTAFTTQDGATWVQTDSQRVAGLPETPFDAELRTGAMGSTFLVPENGARAIRVRLVER
ncbi:MAG TPA: hypothetical protein VLI71_14775 [Gammaproteobacteria bacterium]|nr:hypothetical protein [Gammaproteobacteria bacterium]